MATQMLITNLREVVQGGVAYGKTLKKGKMVGNLAVTCLLTRLMRRAIMESRRTKNLKELVRNQNMKVEELQRLMNEASNTVRDN